MKHHKQGIINWFIRKLIDGQEIEIFGDGKQVRDINYVDDVVEAMLIAMADERSNGEAFNIGGTPLGLADLVKKMIAVYGKGKYRLIEYPSESNKIEIGDYVADWSKFKRQFGWEPKVSIEEGLKRTFEYYTKYKSHYW